MCLVKMVVVAQLVEQRIVIPPVASSNLVDHLQVTIFEMSGFLLFLVFKHTFLS